MRNTACTGNLELPETWFFDSAHALDRQEGMLYAPRLWIGCAVMPRDKLGSAGCLTRDNLSVDDAEQKLDKHVCEVCFDRAIATAEV
jgi:hypothetical protein